MDRIVIHSFYFNLRIRISTLNFRYIRESIDLMFLAIDRQYGGFNRNVRIEYDLSAGTAKNSGTRGKNYDDHGK